LDRSDSPWYPTMRLFRQKEPGNWRGVFEEIEAALRERILLLSCGVVMALQAILSNCLAALHARSGAWGPPSCKRLFCQASIV
jgi:hypothetical protein